MRSCRTISEGQRSWKEKKEGERMIEKTRIHPLSLLCKQVPYFRTDPYSFVAHSSLRIVVHLCASKDSSCQERLDLQEQHGFFRGFDFPFMPSGPDEFFCDSSHMSVVCLFVWLFVSGDLDFLLALSCVLLQR